MKIEQLRYFLEAAKHEHIGKAAVAVSITPSAVSHSISELEAELGRDLFVKKGKNIFLTSHGKVLMERAGKFLGDLEAIKEELASDSVELQGHYKLAATHMLCSQILTPAWARLQEAHGRLTAEIFTLRSAQVIAGVASGAYDYGLCLSPQPHPQLEIEPVYEGRLVLVVAHDHPVLKTPPAQRAAKLSQWPAALPKAFQGVDNCESHPAFAQFGIEPKIRLAYDSYEVAARHLLSTRSWSLFPDWIAKLYGGKLAAIIPSGWHAPLWLSAVRPKNRFHTRALRELSSSVKAFTKKPTPLIS